MTVHAEDAEQEEADGDPDKGDREKESRLPDDMPVSGAGNNGWGLLEIVEVPAEALLHHLAVERKPDGGDDLSDASESSRLYTTSI